MWCSVTVVPAAPTHQPKVLSLQQELLSLFQVEASRWSKDDGAVAGVDYPDPPAAWRNLNVTMTDQEREEAWEAFNERPLSLSELAALREMTISRGKQAGKANARTAAVRGVGTDMMSMTTSDSGSVATLFSEDVNEFPFAGLGSTVELQRVHHSVMRTTPPVSHPNFRRRGRVQSPSPTGYNCARAMDTSCSHPSVANAMHQRYPTVEENADHSDGPMFHPTGLGVGASAFSLRGEADMDAVLRAMLRLSDTPPKAMSSSGAPAAVVGGSGSKRRRPEDFVAEAQRGERHREIAGKRQQSAPVKGCTYRDGISKGNTPVVRHHQNHHIDPFRNVEGSATLDVRGRVMTSQGGVGSRLSRQSRRTRTGDGDFLSAVDRFGRGNHGSTGNKRLRPLTDGSIQGLSESVGVPDMSLAERREAEMIFHTSLGDHPSSVLITSSSSSYSASPSRTRSTSYSDFVSASHSLSGTVQPDTPLDLSSSTRPSDQSRGLGTPTTSMVLRHAQSSSGGSGIKRKLIRKDGSKKKIPLTRQHSKVGTVPKERPRRTASRNKVVQPPGSTANADDMASSRVLLSSQPPGALPAARGLESSRITGDAKDAPVKEANGPRTSANRIIAHPNPTGVEKNASSSTMAESSINVGNSLSARAPMAMDGSNVTAEIQPGIVEQKHEEGGQTSVSAGNDPLEPSPPQQTLPILRSASRGDKRSPLKNGGGAKGRRTAGAHGSNTTSTSSTGNSDNVSNTRSKRGTKTANSRGKAKRLLEGSSGQESTGSLTSQESLASSPQSKASHGTKSSRESTRRSTGITASEANSIPEGSGKLKSPPAIAAIEANSIPAKSGKLKSPPATTRNLPATVVKDPGESANVDELPRLPQGQRARREGSGERRSMNGTPPRATRASVVAGEVVR